MEEFDLDNITPEMVLENMKKNGEIDEESYTEVKFQLCAQQRAINLTGVNPVCLRSNQPAVASLAW